MKRSERNTCASCDEPELNGTPLPLFGSGFAGERIFCVGFKVEGLKIYHSRRRRDRSPTSPASRKRGCWEPPKAGETRSPETPTNQPSRNTYPLSEHELLFTKHPRQNHPQLLSPPNSPGLCRLVRLISGLLRGSFPSVGFLHPGAELACHR